MFTIIDGDYLKRWDRGREIQVSASVDKVFFTTKAMDGAVEVAVKDGIATVPDELLQQAHDITVYAYVGGKCKMNVLAVKDGEKPDDYYYYKLYKNNVDNKEKKIAPKALDDTIRELEDIAGGGSGSGGVTSWNDLEDKPFYDNTVTESLGDTFTWDGNTEGLDHVDADDGEGGTIPYYYRVWDNVPTLEELQQGGTFSAVINGETQTMTFTGEDVITLTESTGGAVSCDDILGVGEAYMLWLVQKDNLSLNSDGDTYTFEKAGIYVISLIYLGFTEISLQINNYNFTKTTGDTKKLDSKYTHNADWNAQEGEDGYIENKPFGETVTYESIGDTYTWDGDTTGLDHVDVTAEGQIVPLFYRICDTPTLEELQQGGMFSIVTKNQTDSGEFSRPSTKGDFAYIAQIDQTIVFALNDGAEFDLLGDSFLVTFEKAGVYVISAEATDNPYISVTLQINNYNFTGHVTTVHKLDSKYMPDSYRAEPDIVFTLDGINDINVDNWTATCNKTFAEVAALYDKYREKLIAVAEGSSTTSDMILMPTMISKIINSSGEVNGYWFAFTVSEVYAIKTIVVAIAEDDIQLFELPLTD